MQQGRLVLLPMSDIRGYDTTGMNAGIYITEAQNMDVSMYMPHFYQNIVELHQFSGQ